MRNAIHERLRALGCRSIPDAGLRSCGVAFHIRKKRDRDHAADAEYRRRKIEDKEDRRARELAEVERLKALGGIERTPEQQREWADLVSRNMHRDIRYFEERRWERKPQIADHA
ncbi:hypothetical protein [Ciceribacter thiooxidans]|uniref:Uncharacterized protein n=1 Tax=Ciceribacter thiooxidans TaxID=1969821 RepID=A0ABV7I0I4_9HYPH|nr:hypothetical protein [Ciceribacter thiooxidans]